jgi:hypothetical protein
VTIKVLTKNDTHVVLNCPDRSSSEKFEWSKDKKPLVESEHIKLDDKDGSNVIVIYNADDKEIYGNYSCKVGNISSDYRVVSKYIN